jgi:hypothetical protein
MFYSSMTAVQGVQGVGPPLCSTGRVATAFSPKLTAVQGVGPPLGPKLTAARL